MSERMTDAPLDPGQVVSIPVPTPLNRQLRSVAERRGVSVERLVRKSLDFGVLINEQSPDTKVLLEHADGRVERIIRR